MCLGYCTVARIESILTPEPSHRSDTPSGTFPPSPSLPTPFRHSNVPLITHRRPPFIQTRPQPSQNSIFDSNTFPTSSTPSQPSKRTPQIAIHNPVP
ncbi:hypothetical protein M405DRAFT_939197 [Rhizopogon salebrosus TDB-379]|nr:hypothetical protein M405DRAFT_939197 [Rhizopogon salebrosus TDB-379]